MKRKKIQSLMRLRALAAAERQAIGHDAELLVYGDIGESWFGDSVAARTVVEQLGQIEAESILVRINSYGGSVTDGIAIYNALREHGARITTRVEGTAASIAALIFMAGDESQMYPNTTLMVHLPHTIAAGNELDMDRAKAALRTFGEVMAASHAAKSGSTPEEEFNFLFDGQDHWFSATAAHEAGYADTVLDNAPAQSDTEARAMPRGAPVFAAMTRYRGAPLQIAASFGEAPRNALVPLEITPPSQPAARAAQHQESFMNWKAIAQSLGLSLPDNCTDTEAKAKVCEKMALAASATDMEVAIALAKRAKDEGRANQPTAPPAADPAAQAAFQAAETGRRAAIRTAFLGFRDRPAVAALETECLDNLNCSVESAREKLLAKLGEGSEPLNGGAPRVSLGATDGQKRIDAMVTATLVRAGLRTDPDTGKPIAFDGANPFRGLTLREIARASLRASGRNPDGMEAMDIARAVLVRGSGQSTSDFPVYLENILHKMVLSGFKAAPSVYSRFCKIGTVTDLREWKRIVPGMIANLELVNEAGEYKNKPMPDGEKEPVSAKRRGNIIEITPEVVINDDLAAIADTATGLGMAGPRTIDRMVFALLALNGGLGPVLTKDGKTVFHADHGNTNTGAPSVALLAAMAEKMQLQTLPGEDAELLDLGPSIAVCRPSLAGDIQVLVDSQYDNDGTKLNKPNKVRGLLRDVVGTARMPATKFYLFADPNVAPVIEVVFLDGQQQVRVVQEENFRTGGLAWRGELNAGAGAIDYRGGQFSTGA